MENNKKLKEQIKLKIAISEIEDEEKDVMNKKNFRIANKIAAVACLCLLTSGIVFAKDIEKFVRERFYFGLGAGVDSAAENGYIAEPKMEKVESETKVETPEVDLGTIVDNINTSVKIDSFLMDDYNLSVEFAFEFDEAIKEVVDLNKLDQITLNDLIVLDEEKRIIFASTSMGEEKFNEFCIEHNLDFKFGECNENYMNNGLNWFPQKISKGLNQCGLVYNMYAEGYPKSKKLEFYFNEITLAEQVNDNNDGAVRNITLIGNWNIHVDVPEKMYNRTSESYRVISCNQENFDIYTAKVMDTGFELGILISDIEKPIYPSEFQQKHIELSKKYEGVIDRNGYSQDWTKFICESPYREMYNEYQIKSHPIDVTGFGVSIIDEEYAKQVLNSETPITGIKIPENAEGSYVLNSNGERFTCTMSPSRKANYNFVSGDKFDFYETFGMTKYDATDRITIVLKYFGENIEIELEKIK